MKTLSFLLLATTLAPLASAAPVPPANPYYTVRTTSSGFTSESFREDRARRDASSNPLDVANQPNSTAQVIQRAGGPIAALSVTAPADLGDGREAVSLDPETKKPKGFKFFAITW